MSKVTTYDLTYYDDLNVADLNQKTPLDKNYLRILFKPGYSVQVREVNQLQSLLQNQINLLGSSVWKDNTAVYGGETTYLPDIKSVVLEIPPQYGNTTILYRNIIDNAEFITYNYQPVNKTLTAKIVGFKELGTTGPQGNLQVRFYIQYENSVVGTNSQNITQFNEFNDAAYTILLNEEFTATYRAQFEEQSPSDVNFPIALLYANYVGFAYGLSCAKGVFYTRGSFVMTPTQTVYIDKVSSDFVVDGYAALRITENIVTAFDDATLFDNAAGTPNFTAPGADRYQLDLSLVWISRTDFQETSESHIKLLSIENGRPKEVSVTDKYAEINEILAQRTREESGDYTLNPFPLTIRETFNGDDLPARCIKEKNRYTIKDLGSTTSSEWAAVGAGLNATIGTTFIATVDAQDSIGTGVVFEESFQYGIYKANDLDFAGYTWSNTLEQKEAIDSAKERYSIVLEPSIAYVDGSRVELKSPLTLFAPKAREIYTTNTDLSADIGNYFIGSFSGNSLPNIGNISNTYTLRNSANADIGECKIKSVEPISGSALYRCFVYDVKFNNTVLYRFDDISKIEIGSGGSAGFFNVDSEQSTLNQSESISGYFKLPYDTAKNINKISYYAKQYFSNTVGSNGKITVSLAPGNAKFINFDESVVMVGGEIFTLGSGSNFTWRYSLNTNISKTIENIENRWTPGETYHIISPIFYTEATATSKTIATATETIALNQSNRKSIFKLSKPDATVIKKVVSGTNINSGLDITSMFELFDDGQREDHYTNARIRYTGEKTIITSITVQYDYFARGEGSNKFYTINSYGDLDRSLIPSYNGIYLSDVIDFRQDIVYDVLAGGQNTDTLVANTGNVVIDPNTPINIEAQFYMPRIDKLVANSNNSFAIITGIPAFNPVEPPTPLGSMTLYTLGIPAYTLNIKDISVNYIDNRRYTMRDIGAIEKRIRNIEYYTSLSLLERSANEKSIFDVETGERFKNGILVDSFLGHSVGDVFDKNYSCSIDRENAVLRPRFNTRNIDLALSSQVSAQDTIDGGKLKLHHSIITLNYQETELISQLKASDTISVQPHIVAKIEGDILLSPSSDNWKDTTTRPDIIVQNDTAFDAIKFIAEQPDLDILGTDWGSWNTVKSNVISNTTDTDVKKIPGPDPKKPNVNRQVVTTTTTTKVTKNELARTGTKTTLTANNVTQSLGEFVREINIMPFMRSRRVYFHATGFLPQTRLYPFFDGQDISLYTHALDKQFFKKPKDVDEETIETYDGLLPKSTNPLKALPLNLSGMTGFTKFDSELITDDNGELYGSFIIPNNSQLKFRTGERIFKLTDDKRNLETSTNTFGVATYVANGLSEVRQESIISTKKPVFNVQSLSDEKTVFDVDTDVDVKTVVYKDPLAQSFVIDSNTYKEGVFVTSVELYFAKKAKVAPVQIALLAMSNGYPSNTVIPYSVVSLPPSQVNVSDDASAPTKFTFINPVFLKSNDEYCLFVNSRDLAYKCHYAILGSVENDGSNALIAKQEYLGVFFTSSNSQTWTAYQDRDLKFKINRARFTSTEGQVEFERKLHTGVDKITITEPGSLYFKTPVITITPSLEETNQLIKDAEAEADIDPVSGKIIKIRVTKRGSGYTKPPIVTITAATGDSGVNAVAQAKLASVPISVYTLSQSSVAVKGTKLTNKIEFGGNDAVTIKKGADNYVSSSYLQGENHIIENNPAKNLSLTTIFTTSDNSISPVLDLDGTSIIAVNNIINNNDKNEGVNVYVNDVATGGSTNAPWTLVDTKKDWIPDYWSITKPSKLKIISGAGAGQTYLITGNSSNTLNLLYLGSGTPTKIDSTSVYTISDNIVSESIEYERIITNVTSSTITDTTRNWKVDNWVGSKVKIVRGTGEGQEATIVANTSNTLTIDPQWEQTPSVSDSYYIIVDKEKIDVTGAAHARYITRKVDLNNPSDRLNIYIAANRPTQNTDIKVYVKLGYDKNTTDDDLDWEIVNPVKAVPISSDLTAYSEVEYVVNPLTDFISFQVKIVMLSNNIIEIPTIKDFRAIATI